MNLASSNLIDLHNPPSRAPKIRAFIPDGDFTIRLSSENKQPFKLEMESDPLRRPAIIKDKLAGYFDYLSSDKKDCATSTGEPKADIPFILWVVPDAKAQTVMAAWTLELAQRFGDDPSVIWIAQRSAIASRMSSPTAGSARDRHGGEVASRGQRAAPTSPRSRAGSAPAGLLREVTP